MEYYYNFIISIFSWLFDINVNKSRFAIIIIGIIYTQYNFKCRFLLLAMILACFIKTVLILFLCKKVINEELNPTDWKTVELLAEEHPYIVAILNKQKEYVCSGSVLDKRTVLTSGSCVKPDPHYVVVGTAVLGQFVNSNNILKVAFAKLHGDYVFEVQEKDPNIFRMHSNIGLVFTERPVLEFFFDGASIGNYYAPELKEKKIFMVGFGSIKTSNAIVLQHQAYHQLACKNPKWYYCICGIEYAETTYDEPFGEGAPVLFGDEVAGVAVSPSGSLGLRAMYNVFTVIAPYISWIEKSKLDSIIELKSRNDGQKIFIDASLIYSYVLLTFSIKLFMF